MTNITKFEGNIERLVKQDKIMVALNQEPPQEWVLEHPFIKDFKYLPIERVEWLLKTFFKTQLKHEVIGFTTTLNAVSVHVRVHYKGFGSDEWMFHDGLGAKEIQTAKGTGSLKLDLSNINRGAVEMALPLAKTIAIKDACDNFGKLFGSDLNRKQKMQYAEDTKLKPIEIGSEVFIKMKDAVKAGTHTIEQIERKYNLTDEVKEALNETI
jgi:hypothetical protein